MIHVLRRSQGKRRLLDQRNRIFETAYALTSEQVSNTMPIVIGLHGPAGVGKDTVADYMVSSWGFQKVSFAGPLKRGVSELFGIPMDDMEDRAAKERTIETWGKSPRELNQWLGTEVMRNQFMTDFFLRRMDKSIEDAGERIVVSDVRFDNEAEYILNNCCGSVWKVKALPRGQMSESAMKHSTEKPLPDSLIDRTVDNNTDLGFTFQQVDNHLQDILPLTLV